MRAVIYARVSTLQNQTVENQLQVLREVAQKKGYTIIKEFCDEGISGAKGRTERKQFDEIGRASCRERV